MVYHLRLVKEIHFLPYGKLVNACQQADEYLVFNYLKNPVSSESAVV
jgi:hypothetical protein